MSSSTRRKPADRSKPAAAPTIPTDDPTIPTIPTDEQEPAMSTTDPTIPTDDPTAGTLLAFTDEHGLGVTFAGAEHVTATGGTPLAPDDDEPAGLADALDALDVIAAMPPAEQADAIAAALDAEQDDAEQAPEQEPAEQVAGPTADERLSLALAAVLSVARQDDDAPNLSDATAADLFVRIITGARGAERKRLRIVAGDLIDDAREQADDAADAADEQDDDAAGAAAALVVAALRSLRRAVKAADATPSVAPVADPRTLAAQRFASLLLAQHVTLASFGADDAEAITSHALLLAQASSVTALLAPGSAGDASAIRDAAARAVAAVAGKRPGSSSAGKPAGSTLPAGGTGGARRNVAAHVAYVLLHASDDDAAAMTHTTTSKRPSPQYGTANAGGTYSGVGAITNRVEAGDVPGVVHTTSAAGASAARLADREQAARFVARTLGAEHVPAADAAAFGLDAADDAADDAAGADDAATLDAAEQASA